jgi:hypothetical protein
MVQAACWHAIGDHRATKNCLEKYNQIDSKDQHVERIERAVCQHLVNYHLENQCRCQREYL